MYWINRVGEGEDVGVGVGEMISMIVTD
jgi:hypothetical protein